MSVGFITPDPLNNLSNLFQRPIFIQAARLPTINDVYPPQTTWGDGGTPIQSLYVTPGQGIWYLYAPAGGGSLNSINLVAPVAGNINLINQAGAGAITVTAPGSGGAGTVGIGVNVDGVTIQIIGNQLVATAVAPALTLTGDNGVARPYLANNFNFNGGPGATVVGQGAIYFDSTAAGQMRGTVQVDNATIQINASNQLEAVGVLMFSLSTVGAVSAFTPDIPIPANNTTIINADFAVINNATFVTGAANLASGGARDTAGVVTILGTGDFVDVALNEDAALIALNYNLLPGGGASTVRIEVVGVAGQNLNWKICVKLCSTP